MSPSDVERRGGAAPRQRGPGESPGILLWRAANAWQRETRAALRAHGLSHAQFVLLLGLHHLESRPAAAPAATTQRRLAAYCGVDTAMASQVLRQLETAGLLRRAPARDARSRALRLTDNGRRAVTAAMPDVAAVEARFFAALGDNSEMFKAAVQVLLGLPPRLGASRQAG